MFHCLTPMQEPNTTSHTYPERRTLDGLKWDHCQVLSRAKILSIFRNELSPRNSHLQKKKKWSKEKSWTAWSVVPVPGKFYNKSSLYSSSGEHVLWTARMTPFSVYLWKLVNLECQHLLFKIKPWPLMFPCAVFWKLKERSCLLGCGTLLCQQHPVVSGLWALVAINWASRSHLQNMKCHF